SQGDTVNGQGLRPTLYDLLAHRALAQFSNERNYLTAPAYKFELDAENAFAPAADFVKIKFTSPDSTSSKLLAINLFQRVLTAHQADRDPSALIDADLVRLQLVRNNSVREDKDRLYENALETLHKKHYDHPSDAEIVYHLAEYLYNIPTGDQGAQAKRAVTECEDAMRRHPGSYGARLCSQLLENIRAMELNMQTEEVYLPEKNMLVSLNVRNLTSVWTKVVRVPDDPDIWINIAYNQKLNYLNGLQGMQNRTWKIPDPGDYQQHRTEIALEPLPLGNYWVLVSSNINFDPKKGPVTFTNFHCSNLAAVQYSEEGLSHFVVANRQSGLPVAGAKLDF
ncbi:MAG: hypothetical protein LH618_04685, partial [Saprospiraceae bacterium]|nr:hypothetical protein [Saprospiraceae bacterium]